MGRAYFYRLALLLLFMAAPVAAKEQHEYQTGKLLDARMMRVGPDRELRAYRIQAGDKLYFVYSLTERDPLINLAPGTAIQFRLDGGKFVYAHFWEGRRKRKNMSALVTSEVQEFKYDILGGDSNAPRAP